MMIRRGWPCVLVCLLLCGCDGDSGTNTTPRPEQRELEFADGTTATVEWRDGRAVSLTMQDEPSISLADAETLVHDQLVIRTPDGRVEVHRKPNTVMDDMSRLPYLYLQEGTLEEFMSEGFRGEPYIGSDRTLYWSACICTNPNCDSQSMASAERPYLFINRLPGVWLGDDGKLVSANKMPASLTNPCPVCGRAGHIHQYILPGTAHRQAELAGELVRSRAARRAATRSN